MHAVQKGSFPQLAVSHHVRKFFLLHHYDFSISSKSRVEPPRLSSPHKEKLSLGSCLVWSPETQLAQSVGQVWVLHKHRHTHPGFYGHRSLPWLLGLACHSPETRLMWPFCLLIGRGNQKILTTHSKYFLKIK